VEEIRSRQQSLRQELNQLAAHIEELKSQRKGALISGSDLQGSLRRSQELSGLLTDAARELASAEDQSQKENLALLGALTDQLAQLKGQWERTQDKSERRQILVQMRSLRQEREQVRAQLPAAALPAFEASKSDDPEDLLEQADALRDSEDKVRQRMQQLKSRIAELREERDLDRRMGEFLGEEALFDDQDSRLRLTRESDATSQSDRSNTTTTASNAAPGPAAPGAGGFTNSPGTGGTPSGPPPSNSTPQITHATDARPEVGTPGAAVLEGNDLKALESQYKDLDTLSKQLEKKAKQIEERAHELE
jgi:phage shock protein A